MCFSAAASFSAAALTGTTGAVTLAHVSKAREIPLASMPLLFSLQQAIEGTLWLILPRGRGPAQALVAMFLTIALVVWPVLAPLAIGLVESQRTRRVLIFALLPAGVAVAVYSALSLVQHPYAASLTGSGICYISGVPYPSAIFAAYVLCICIPLLLSTNFLLKIFGIVVVIGMIVSNLVYYVGFISVWCFFAATASGVIWLFFPKTARRRVARDLIDLSQFSA